MLICGKCHGKNHSLLLERYKENINKNIKHLTKNGYKFNQLDKDFIEYHDLLESLKELIKE
jgi:biotin operon repressor